MANTDNLKASISEKTGRVLLSFDPNEVIGRTQKDTGDILVNANWLDLGQFDESLKGVVFKGLIMRKDAVKPKASAKTGKVTRGAAKAKPETVPFDSDMKADIMDCVEDMTAKQAKAVWEKLTEDEFDWDVRPRAFKQGVLDAYNELFNADDGEGESGDDEVTGDDDEEASSAYEAPAYPTVKALIQDSADCTAREARAIYNALVEEEFDFEQSERAQKKAYVQKHAELADEAPAEPEADEEEAPAPRKAAKSVGTKKVVKPTAKKVVAGKKAGSALDRAKARRGK